MIPYGRVVLLPCNVVVQQEEDQTIVSIIDTPLALLSIVGNPSLESLAEDINARLQRVLDRIAEREAPATL